MATERTRGMMIVGYLNIGVGAIFALVGGMAFAGGGFMGTAKAAGIPGDFIMLVGLATSAVNLMLLAAGIGVLRMAVWGRSLSLAYAAMGIVVYSSWIIGKGFDPFFIAALVHCLVLFGLFFRPEWKSAFEPVRRSRRPDANDFGQARSGVRRFTTEDTEDTERTRR